MFSSEKLNTKKDVDNENKASASNPIQQHMFGIFGEPKGKRNAEIFIIVIACEKTRFKAF